MLQRVGRRGLEAASRSLEQRVATPWVAMHSPAKGEIKR